jgi:protein TonB
VSFVEVVAGHPLLIPAAMEAVKQYRYQAAKVDEKPVEVATQADVTFSL